MEEMSAHFAVHGNAKGVSEAIREHLSEAAGTSECQDSVTVVKLITTSVGGRERLGLIVQRCHAVPQDLREEYRLTKRQSEVASMLAARMSNEEIADCLGITVNTVKRHVEAVLFRMGIHSRNGVRDVIERAHVRLLRMG